MATRSFCVYVVGDNPLTRLVAGQELAELVLRTAQSPIVIWDAGGRPVAFNQSFCDTFGYSPEEARTLTHSALIHADERELVRASVGERAPGDHSRRTFRRRLIARDGRVVHVEGSSVGLPMGDQTALLVEYRDVTAQTVARLTLEELEARYKRIFERAPIAIFTTSGDNHIDFANPACLELLDRTAEELSQLTPMDLVAPAYRQLAVARRKARPQRRPEVDEPFQVPIMRGDGSAFWCEVTTMPRYDDAGTFLGVDGFARDISAERASRFELASQAATDALTELPNRRRFEAFLDEHVNEARRYRTPLSLLVLDLDHFKRVNDTLGHLAGDAVLRAVAGALSSIARETDLVARYGGEEFAVVLPHTDATGAAAAAERCRTAIEVLVTSWNEAAVRITTSVGVATYSPALHESAAELFADADGAVYAAKATGRNRVCVANDLAPEQRLASA